LGDTAIIERDYLGGICLNWGCIPTKALLRSSEIWHLMHRLNEFGFSADNFKFDIENIVKRSRAVIDKSLGDYFIFEIDKNPVACVALHVYPEQNKGELACLYVSAPHENQGIGRKLIQFVENKAKELNLAELLTLSTQAFTYFQSKGGFGEGTPDDLPPARREKYEQSGRNSKVLVKKLK